METRTVQVGDVLIGSRENIVIQTMCNTHTNEVEATVEQCRRMAPISIFPLQPPSP